MTRTSGDHMDLTDAFAARDRALRKVDEHADEAWKQQALEAVRRTAKQLPDFISDRVWDVGGLESTREDRALGPVFLRAARLGWIEKTDRVRPSVRSHGSGKTVWRSRLFDPGFGSGQLFSTPPTAPGNAISGEAA